MTTSERQKYSGERVDLKTYNCVGESIEQVRNTEMQEKLKRNADILKIEEMVQIAYENDVLFTTQFFFISTSFFYKTSSNIYPAELALCRFSLEKGVIDTMNIVIDPGRLPTGSACDAMQHSKKYHHFELPPNYINEEIERESSYENILKAILQFVNAKNFTSSQVPPFFVFSEFEQFNINAAKLTLNKIADENNLDDAFRLYEAEQLLFSMNKRTTMYHNQKYKTDKQPINSKLIAMEMLRKDDFAYYEIGCKFHNGESNPTNCCLSKVQRWVYMFAKYCLDSSFKKLPGHHYPEDYEPVEKTFTLEDYPSHTTGLTESFRAFNISKSNSSIGDTKSNLSAKVVELRKSSSKISVVSSWRQFAPSHKNELTTLSEDNRSNEFN
jgi:hypothetical protein